MAGILKKFLPLVPSSTKEEGNDYDQSSYEYSFALEYSGPAVARDIPRAMPVDIYQIPVAAPIASASMLKDVALPVIQPIRKSNPSNKKLHNVSNLDFDDNRVCNGNNMSLRCESSNGVHNSGALSCTTGDECRPDLSDQMDSCSRIGSTNSGECRTNFSDGMESSARLDSANGGECGTNFSDGMENSARLVSANGEECMLSDDIQSSGKLGTCVVRDHCHELSGSLRMLRLSDDNSKVDADGDFQDYMDPVGCESMASDSISCSVSSEIFSCKDDECIEEIPGHVRRPSIVTFRDPEPNDIVQEQSDPSEAESSIPVRQMAVRPGKKGTCYRCSKGNRFTEKEVCIVCGAKYCFNCVVRAMGSMPEGRKCITCIGQRIDESKRKSLGKCSWMLKQLLTELEVKQIMISERSCEVNQLPPELVYVNGTSLSQREYLILQKCANPPKKLKPGYYWYDKVSGFWGKEGHKPCQIIYPQLNVGGHIRKDASNGDTNIFINNREITREELWMLKWVGVKCEGTMSFWLSADGDYQEEGMNAIKGNIWVKHKAKMICAFLSLPTPPRFSSPSGDEVNTIATNNHELKMTYKLLLVGSKNSGTSTIFKQAKIVYKIPFTEEERHGIKCMIQSNLYGYLGILLEGRERFEEECLIKKTTRDRCNSSGQINRKTMYSIDPGLKVFSDWLLNVMVSGNLETIFPAATREYAPFVEKLWKDAAIQATYERRSELELLPRVATYFLERAVEIAMADYQPSDMDILYAEGIISSKGLSSMEFLFPNSAEESSELNDYQHDPSLRYQLIRAHPSVLGGNCKWLEMFEDVDIVLFCVSLTDYDEFEDVNGVPTNKMMASKQLFETIVTNPTFEEKKFLLILNKFDLLEQKIEHVPLKRCEWFHDFNPVIGHNPIGSSSSRSTNTPLAQRAFQYIAVKFKRMFRALTDKTLYVSLVTGLEPDNVDDAVRYAREILKYDKEEFVFPNQELSSASAEVSSSS